MLIGGLEKQSLVDYNGKISLVVFTVGCNFRCSFCHNPELVCGVARDVIAQKEVFSYLMRNRKMIDAVVISGGEPTLQVGLLDFVKKLKEMSFLVKIDTNGTNFEVLERLVLEGLVDFVAMDVKTCLNFQSYKKIVKSLDEESFESVKRSIAFLKRGYVDYEFRTTLVRDLMSLEDVKMIYDYIKPAKMYSLQRFRSDRVLKSDFDVDKVFSSKDLEGLRSSFVEIEEVVIR